MTDYKQGDLVLVSFPFSDLSTTKQRPALVLSVVTPRTFPKLFVVAMLTSQIESEEIEGDHIVKDWKEAGLLHPSKVRLSKVVSLEEGLLKKKLGTLALKDRRQVKSKFLRLFASL